MFLTGEWISCADATAARRSAAGEGLRPAGEDSGEGTVRRTGRTVIGPMSFDFGVRRFSGSSRVAVAVMPRTKT